MHTLVLKKNGLRFAVTFLMNLHNDCVLFWAIAVKAIRLKCMGGSGPENFSSSPRDIFQLVLIPLTTYFNSFHDTHMYCDALFLMPTPP